MGQGGCLSSPAVNLHLHDGALPANGDIAAVEHVESEGWRHNIFRVDHTFRFTFDFYLFKTFLINFGNEIDDRCLL